jgi:hypothetical protein
VVEAEDLPDVRPSPAVDRLVVVAHHAHVPVRAADLADDLVLRVVRVLVLVHEDVAVALAIALAHLRVLAQQAHGLEEEVVEVERARAGEVLAVALPDRPDQLVAPVGAGLQEGLGRLHAVLGERDAGEHGRGVHGRLVDPQLAHGRLHGTQLVRGVADGELAGVAQGGAVLAQDAGAERVERPHRDLARPLAGEVGHALLHLARRLVREGDGEDARGGDAEREEVGDASGDDARLAGARPGQDEERALGGRGRVPLRGVERGEEGAVGPGDGATRRGGALGGS